MSSDVFELYQSGLSIPEISDIKNIARSTVRHWLSKAGILRARADAVRLAAKKGKLGANRGTKRVFTDEWKRNISKGKLGKGCGYSEKPNGYIELTMGENKSRSVHVVLMEEKIGRRLLPGECVHHINGNRNDNRIENLKLMTRSEHARFHAIENGFRRVRNKKGQYV